MRKLWTMISNPFECSAAKSKDALFVFATVLMVVALAGCGGGIGGKTAALPTPMDIGELPRGSMLEEPRTLRPGETLTVRETDGMRTTIKCPEDGEACDLTSGPDGAIRYTGGMPTVDTVPYTTIELPEGHELMAGEIAAGDERTVHRTFETRTVVTCPADGEDCDVTAVTENGAESTGGAPTVTTYTTLFLPSGHTLTEGTIPAGGSLAIGSYSKGRNYDIECPADGEDCVVTLGEYDFEYTGGTPYLRYRYNQIVWQGNNGPDGTSNGAHARGLQELLLEPGGSLHSMFGAGANQRSRFSGSLRKATSTPVVTPTASWASSDTAPTLGLTVSNTGANTFSVDGDSDVLSLGTGWNGAALGKTVPTGRTARAVIYSDITKQPTGGSADTYYTILGAWLVLPDSSTAGRTQYDWGAFVLGNAGSIWGANIRSLTGTATYIGPATGLYSKATYTGSGGTRALESAEMGSFTATAALSANFGGGGTFSGIGGNVTDFRESGESLGNWTVTFDSSSNQNSGERTYHNSVSGGADGRNFQRGRWTAEFFRSAGSGHPDKVLGIFTASTIDNINDALHIVGGFSAERE